MSSPIVCVQCSKLMKVHKNGVVALEMLDNGLDPYRIYRFDSWKCPGCNMEVLRGSGRPTYPSDKDWEQDLERVTIRYL